MAISDTTLIIPQFNRSELTIRCVQTLLAAHASRPAVIVVDDGSEAGEVAAVRASLGNEVTILARNHQGVTAAWNAGLLASQSEWLIFLNNDTLTYGPWVDELLTPLRVGAARMAGVNWRRERHLPRGFRGDATDDRMLEGWCFAIRRDGLLDLGGFDRTLRRYFSDTDLQLRLRRRFPDGESRLAVEGLPLGHLGHATAHRLADRIPQWRRDRRAFLRKWSPEYGMESVTKEIC